MTVRADSNFDTIVLILTSNTVGAIRCTDFAGNVAGSFAGGGLLTHCLKLWRPILEIPFSVFSITSLLFGNNR